MDDLLIVRRSDRSKERYRRSRRSEQTPLGANLGILIGAGLGFFYAVNSGVSPQTGLLIGVVLGVALGGILGRVLRPRRRFTPSPKRYSYQGMPFESEDTDDDSQDADSSDFSPQPTDSQR